MSGLFTNSPSVVNLPLSNSIVSLTYMLCNMKVSLAHFMIDGLKNVPEVHKIEECNLRTLKLSQCPLIIIPNCIRPQTTLKLLTTLDYCQALYHEPLAWVIAQALPVFDIKFAFFHSSLW